MTPRRDLRWLSLAIVSVGLLSVNHIGILAQSSTIVCLSQFGWMNNSKGQNPCLVAAYLQGACYYSEYTVYPLPSDYFYVGPNKDEVNACQCSTVTYNALSACGYCQNRTYISWSKWDANCTTIYPGVFPPGVPEGTAVPHWAFQDVTGSDHFNVTLAQLTGDSPESTPTVTHPTGLISSTSTHPPLTTLPPTPTSTSAPTPTGNNLNVGAVTGGVAGGVVGIALIAGVIVFLVMRRRPQNRPPNSTPTSPAPVSAVFSDSTILGSHPQPKLYDPSDPSTFPATPPQPPITGSPYDYPTGTNPPLHSRGYYSG